LEEAIAIGFQKLALKSARSTKKQGDEEGMEKINGSRDQIIKVAGRDGFIGGEKESIHPAAAAIIWGALGLI
jgi:hypothetical protein